jgi:predicted transcriptional regulator
MRRTQILLENGQHEALDALARETDRSLSEIVRTAVDQLIGKRAGHGRNARLTDIKGLATDRRGPSGRDHDRILYGQSR